ncbi:MAG: ABC transporter ATP-binding protein [Alphaproteobacteria bacterium]|nr:MAG: ABC transporter ATP-binding protein [Alphaproteobacteria bacterium]
MAYGPQYHRLGEDTIAEENKIQQALGWVGKFIRPEIKSLSLVMVLAACMTGFALAQPYFTKILIDDGLLAGNMDMVIRFAVLIVIMSFVVFAVSGFNRWLYVGLSGRILFRLREDVYDHLMKLSPAFYGRWRTGDIVSRLDGDVAEVQRFSTDSLLAVVNGSLALIGSLIIMLLLSWQLTLIAFALLPLQVIFLRRMRPLVEKGSRILREKSADVSSFFIETLPAAKFIQSLSATGHEQARLTRLNHGYLDELLKLQIINHVTGGVPGLLTGIATACVFVIGGYFVTQGTATIGTLIAFSAYMARATGPVQTFLGLYVAYQRAMVSLVRVQALKNQKIAVIDPATPVLIGGKAQGDLKLDRVSFFYDEAQARGVQNISFHIRPGEKILITGPSGSGKSTLINLLHRHYDPSAGGLWLDGVSYPDLSLKELRTIIAVVDQNTILFHGTVRDNIAYGVKDAIPAQVAAAAKAARIDAFIESLPQGYDTAIGERGARLSGGQQQRLSIARALLMKPKVLILDEATSAVDRETEAEFQQMLDQYFADSTRIIISHHGGAIRNPDRVFSMRDGRLTEDEA